MDRERQTDRQTVTLSYEISTMWETKFKEVASKTSSLLVGPQEVTRAKILQAV